jgi:H2-forming N5,N10-methylenetetrahydromethanopterin dehydrogenase-like enzyme
MNSLKDEIQQRYLKRADVENMMDDARASKSSMIGSILWTPLPTNSKRHGREITQRLENPRA